MSSGGHSGRIWIGTSGWHYQHWKGPFYPEKARNSELLGLYSREFDCVEVNNTFYGTPSIETVEMWRDTVPEDFRFAVKASRYITHVKKMKDAAKPVERLYELLTHLGKRLGAVLYQLPPHWQANPERLAEFLAVLPDPKNCAFELRDESWFSEEVLAVLRASGAGFCIYELGGRQSPRAVTGQMVYIRLHGPGAKYSGLYGRRLLAPWAKEISAWARSGHEVYCFFDNDEAGYAVKDALLLRQMLSG